jgi:thiol-disulfide isomerase/thioredoxin
MSEGPQAPAKPKRGLLGWALWGAALSGVAGVVYIIGQASSNPAPTVATEVAEPKAPAAESFAQKFEPAETPGGPPDHTIYNEAGKPMKIADLKGKVVIMNIWATWCGPCKIEMPTLAKLQAAYAGQPVEVVAVSIDDMEDAAQARLFIAANAPLKFYHDREMKLAFKLSPPAPGMPTTVIYGKDGLEVGRLPGEADWSGAEARAVIDKALGG